MNVQHVLALVDTGDECFLISGNPECFSGTPAVTGGYGGKAIRVKKAQISLGIGHLPPKEYTMYISPIPEYILGVDIEGPPPVRWQTSGFSSGSSVPAGAT